jgi:hypothetical protein
MKISLTHRTATLMLGAALVAWLAGSAARRGLAQAAEPAAGPALRHEFINNVDAGKHPPNARGYLTVTFKTRLPAAPTILLQCANPRYAVKVHGASPTGFVYALYRVRDILDSPAANPYEGEKAAKPVTNYKAAQNIDVAWVAIAD